MKILVVLAISALSLTAYAGTHKVESLDKVEATQSLCSGQSLADTGIDVKPDVEFNEACLCCATTHASFCCEDCHGKSLPDVEGGYGRSASPAIDLDLDVTS